ncbi:MAG: hypothetical protein PHY40_01420 [Patescibacteria group bacterium]|jgi:hypothetical protein|nr:hypothetical protein [Patescibacteria group bacterium]
MSEEKKTMNPNELLKELLPTEDKRLNTQTLLLHIPKQGIEINELMLKMKEIRGMTEHEVLWNILNNWNSLDVEKVNVLIIIKVKDGLKRSTELF